LRDMDIRNVVRGGGGAVRRIAVSARKERRSFARRM
jgi:hypothetical protein